LLVLTTGTLGAPTETQAVPSEGLLWSGLAQIAKVNKSSVVVQVRFQFSKGHILHTEVVQFDINSRLIGDGNQFGQSNTMGRTLIQKFVAMSAIQEIQNGNKKIPNGKVRI